LSMKEVTLGRSGLRCSYLGFELGPLQAVGYEKGKELVSRVLDRGVTLLDIGMPVEELQKKIGHAIAAKRGHLVLAGSFIPSTPKVFETELKMTLRALKTDYLDLCQIHDPDYLPRTNDHIGVYDAMIKAKEMGYIRSIGLTTATFEIAQDALEFGWYDTLQYPWTEKSGQDDQDLLDFAHDAMMGSISLPQEGYPDRTKEELAFHRQKEDHAALFELKEEGLDRFLSGWEE